MKSFQDAPVVNNSIVIQKVIANNNLNLADSSLNKRSNSTNMVSHTQIR
jgi:hypothetical protein